MIHPKGFSEEKLRILEEKLENHVWNNRTEIEASQICMCTACYFRFKPTEITKWQDGKSAICPNPDCGLGGNVIGSASGLSFEDYDYSK